MPDTPMLPDKKSPDPQLRYVWPVIVVSVGVRLLLLSRMDLLPDEAYYWDWSRNLSLGYYDHPPLLAWLLRISTILVGNTYLGIKLGTLVSIVISSLLMYFLGSRFFGDKKSGVLLVILLNITLIYAVGGLLITPDLPLIMFWAAALFLAYLALFEGRDGAWVLLGVVMGLGMLSKYIFVLFAAGLFLIMIIDRSFRKLFFTWRPWTSAAVALLIFSPNIMWNAQNHWISMGFQLRHGMESSEPWPQTKYLIEYMAGQIGLLSPLVFVLLILATILVLKKFPRDKKLIFLLIFTYLPLIFFIIPSLGKRVEANWPSPAFLTALTLVTWYRERTRHHIKLNRFINIAFLFSGVSTLLVILHGFVPVFPVPLQKDRSLDYRGWDHLAQQVYEVRHSDNRLHKLPVCTNTYQLAALLAYHSPDQPHTLSLNLYNRNNHYEFLKNRYLSVNDTLLFVELNNEYSFSEKYRDSFSRAEILAEITREAGKKYTEHYNVYRVVLSENGKQRVMGIR